MDFAPIEQRIFDLTADGLPHERNELLECINDKYASLNNLAVRIWGMRRKLRAMGQDILTEKRRGGIYYRRVILLSGTDVSLDPL